MYEIIFLDKDTHYTATITKLLSYAFSKASLFSFNTLTELEKHSKKKDITLSILFINIEEFDPPNFLGESFYLHSFKNQSLNSIYKFSPLSEFVRVINEAIGSYAQRAAEYKETENICCIIGDCSIRYRNKFISELILQKLSEGFIPAIAELCPRHQGYANEDYHVTKRNLSDFMMRIISQNTKDLAPSLYVEPMSDASLKFRPFQYTDDLYDCSGENIREFIHILNSWIDNNPQQMYLIITLWSVPFSFIYSACIQSKKIVILNGSDKSIHSQEFNKEISSLLSNLRSTVKVNIFYEFPKGEEHVLSK